MRRLGFILLAVLCAITASAQRYAGGDVSLLKAYEDRNATYYDQNGKKIDSLLPYLKDNCGMNAMRVRLFHTPSNATADEKGQGVFQDLNYVKALGKEIKDAGLAFMLDFHYSDTWADPSKQWTPKAWLGLSNSILADSIYNYTKQSLQALVDAGAKPDFIQIGNEISYGMCWGKRGTSANRYYADGKNNTAAKTRFISLLKSASKACREVCPEAKIIIHTERVARPNYIVDYYTDMDKNGVDYDIIGTSYYSYYHGYLPQLEKALNAIEGYTKKDIMIVETGYYYQYQTDKADYDYSSKYPVSPAGQKAFTEAMIKVLDKHPQVKGLFWWEMDANDNSAWMKNGWNKDHVLNNWYNAGLVNENNSRLLPAAYVLKDFINSTTGISGVKATKKSHDNRWYTLQGQRINEPAASGIYINNGKKVAITK